MGDAVRRVQKHLQDLARDHLVSVEDRHQANLGWLQIEFQKICEQIEVDVRVELTRPPRLSFTKPPSALVAGFSTTAQLDKPANHSEAIVNDKPVSSAVTTTSDTRSAPAVSTAIAEERVSTTVELPPATVPVENPFRTRKAASPIKLDFSSDKEDVHASHTQHTEAPVVEEPVKKKMVKHIVKKTRTVLKPKRIVKKERRAVKQTNQALPVIDVCALKVVDLKSELKKRGLKQTGVKAVLADRLRQALEEEDALQAMEEDADQVFEEVEVVEEIMEEVEEEYEEEIEEEEPEVDDQPVPTLTQPEPVEQPAEVLETPVIVIEDSDVSSPETQRMAAEDTDVSLSAGHARTLPVIYEAKETMAPAAVASKVEHENTPDKSLSDLVEPPAVDEIVRESEDFASPPVRALVAPMAAPTSSPAEPEESHPPAASEETKDRTLPTEQVIPAPPKPSSALLTGGSVLSKLREETAKRAAAMLSAAKNLASGSTPGSQTKAPNSEPSTANSNSSLSMQDSLFSAPMKASLGSDSASSYGAATSNTSLASRSSSVSPFATLNRAGREIGDMSIVGESPSDASFTLGEATATRAASISQIDVRSTLARMKTPEATMPVERASQSEPKLAPKPVVESEDQRRQREHQENIEREALRIRMAMKQSAKKRFEEAKGSSSFWAKREQAKLEQQRVPASSPHDDFTPLAQRASTSSTPVTPLTEGYAPALSAPPYSAIVDLVEEDRTSELNEKRDIEEKTTELTARETKLDASKVIKTASASVSTTAPATKKAVDTKRLFLTRKRSSIVVADGSTSNLYPSKRRVSQARSREDRDSQDGKPQKRSSVTSSRTVEPGTSGKRGSLTRDEPSKAMPTRKRPSGSLDKSIQPPLKKRARSSAGSDLDVVSSFTAKSKIPIKRRESASSSTSSSSNKSGNSQSTKAGSALPSAGAQRKPSNLVSGLHSFTSLLDKDTANISSSQGSSTSSSSRQAPVVSALKLAERNRLIEQKKNLEKMKRKEALVKKYEEQRKLDEEKKKKSAQMKEKAERDARLKREQEKISEKRQRELELAKKRQQRIQEMRAGLERKKALGAESSVAKSTSTAAPVARVGASSTSTTQQLKVSAASSRNVPPSKSARTVHKEVTTYAMSENEPSESEASDGEKDNERNSKNIPTWAQRENLQRILRHQFSSQVDPTPSIFPEFDATCDLEAIFEPTDIRKKKRFQRRTSSGNWLADRTTTREKAVYKRDMGFQL